MNDSHTSHDGTSHGSHKSYTVGLILSIALTLAAFGVVMLGKFSILATAITVIVTAVVQVLVQLILFMHLEFRTQQGRYRQPLEDGAAVASILRQDRQTEGETTDQQQERPDQHER